MACLNRGIFLCLFRFYCFDIQLFILLLQSIQFLLLLYLAAKFLLSRHQRHVFGGKKIVALGALQVVIHPHIHVHLPHVLVGDLSLFPTPFP